MKKFLSFILLFSIFYSCNNNEKQSIFLYHIDTMDKVLKERGVIHDEIDTIHVARGEYASIQMVVKTFDFIDDLTVKCKGISNGKITLTPQQVGLVGYVRASHRYKPSSVYMIHSPSTYYPDPIYTDTVVNLHPGELQPIWVTIPIPKNIEPGLYNGEVEVTGIVNGVKKKYTKEFTTKIYPAKVERSTLWVTNWMNFSPTALSYLNAGKPVYAFTNLYWELVEKFANLVASYGQNMHRIYPLWLTEYALDENGKFTFDFTNFDKEVDIFEKVGSLERIEGGHFAWRSGEWDDPYFVEVPIYDPENKEPNSSGSVFLKGVNYNNGLSLVTIPLSDPRSKNFYDQFLPALKNHLKKKGWYDKYVQHIADEPVDANTESYIAISSYIKKHMPEVKILDALMASKKLAGSVDIWIPLLDIFDEDLDFFKELQTKGKEVWMYTCSPLRGDYANRYVELPLLLTRYLHWINYKYNATGYLHWGLNFWSEFDMPIMETSRHRGDIPSGDCFIVYPGYHKLYTSIRFEAMRDGIYDYELLKLLEKKDPVKAKMLASEVVQDFGLYDETISWFRKIRKEILESLSE